MKRLNGWQRIGVILSVAWIIGGGLWRLGANREYAIRPIVYHMNICSAEYDVNDPNRSVQAYTKCMDRAMAVPPLQSDAETAVAAVVETFALLGLAWLLIYALVWIARCVRTGFKQSASQP